MYILYLYKYYNYYYIIIVPKNIIIIYVYNSQSYRIACAPHSCAHSCDGFQLVLTAYLSNFDVVKALNRVISKKDGWNLSKVIAGWVLVTRCAGILS